MQLTRIDIAQSLVTFQILYYVHNGLTQAGEQLVHVGQDKRLDYRVIDLRTAANQAIFRVQCQVENVSSCHFMGQKHGVQS